ncbi:MAG: hypothetical protein P8165_18525, partial [Deltaproteobacteria bacterium]
GISLSGFGLADDQEQQDLFARDAPRQDRGSFNRAMDRIMEKHGGKGVRPGALFSDEEGQR